MTSGAGGSLLEVAVALPVQGTFTYRDPRAGAAAPIGAQVVVPFGARTVTGFVVARAAAGSGGAETRDIEEIVAGEPPFDEAMIGFCRFAAEYYQAPLGEVLRAALPQGEQASATRAVRLTESGRRTVGRQQSLVEGGAVDDPVLAALAAAGGELPLRRLVRAVPKAERRLPKLAAAGLIEIGDEVQGRRPPPAVAIAHATEAAVAAIPARARARQAVARRIAAAPDGLEVASLSPAERTQLRALVAAGQARIEQREVARVEEARAAARASGVTLNAAQAAAVAALVAAQAGGYASFLLHGVTGSGKTEVYLRVIQAARAAGKGALVLVPEIALTPQLAARFRSRFGDDVAVLHSGLPPRERLAAWRSLRAGQVGIALGRAVSRVRARARAGRCRRRRGARPVVQAGGRRPLPRARSGDRARAACRRGGDPGLGDAVARERPQRRPRAVHAARAAGARHAATAARRRDHRSGTQPARSRRRSVIAAGGRAGRRRWRRASRASCSSTGVGSRPSRCAARVGTWFAVTAARCR